MSSCSAILIPLGLPSPRTLSELRDRVDASLTQRIEEGAASKKVKANKGDSAAYWERNALRTALRHLVKLLDHRSLELIDIEEILNFTPEDYEQRLDVTPRRAIWHVGMQNKLLSYAASYGWTCESYQRREAWTPIRAALRSSKGGSLGCQGIVTFALRNGWLPSTFCDAAMNAWITWMIKDSHSIRTVESEEWSFRKKLRDADLQRLFPNFSLASKNPDPYYLRVDKVTGVLTGALGEELLCIIQWKLHQCPVEFRIRQSSADRLLEMLRGLCGYAIYVRGICGITTLRQVITEEIITEYITWLHDTRECGWNSVRSDLGRVHALITQSHPLFADKKGEYAWFGLALQQIPKESKEELRKRKIDKSVAYAEFAELAIKIRAELEGNRDLDPFARACLFRDYLFCSVLQRHPWRQRNLRECRVGEGNHPNIFYDEIPEDVLRDLKLSPEEQRMFAADQAHAVWLCHFVEAETKGSKEIWERLDLELVEPLKEYVDVHRPVLVRRGPGSASLFVSNSGRQMSKNRMASLLAELSLRYISKRLSPHIVRDIVTENALANGCTFEQIQAMLWHILAKSTQRYLSGFNASHAAVALEKHFAA
jgi:hypothetical protein